MGHRKLERRDRLVTLKVNRGRPDRIPDIWGHVSLEIYRNGKYWKTISGSNVVTNAGKVHILRVMRGAPGFTPVSRMHVGDGGCGAPFPATSALFTPVVFTATDAALRLPLTSTPAALEAYNEASHLNQGARTMQYIAVIPSATAAGFHNGVGQPKVINEIALLSGAGDPGGGVVVALRAFRSIPFDPTDAVEVRAIWTIGLP